MAALDLGEGAPDFALAGTDEHTYRLSDYQGIGVILAFYPGDFTAVCTRQLCAYRDDSDRLAKLGVDVLGISPQSVDSHERFVAKHDLTVPLLADTEKLAARAYGVLGPLGIVRRSIFVIDANLIIRYRDIKTFGLTYASAKQLEKAAASLR